MLFCKPVFFGIYLFIYSYFKSRLNLVVRKLTPNSDFNGMVKQGLVRPLHFSDLLQFSHKIPSLLNFNGQGHLHFDMCNLIKLPWLCETNLGVELQLQIVPEVGAFFFLSLFTMAFPHSNEQQPCCLFSPFLRKTCSQREKQSNKTVPTHWPAGQL